MSAEPAEPGIRDTVRGSLARRADVVLDPVIALAAVGMSLTSLLTTHVGDVDPRLHEPNLFAAVATVISAGALIWRRTHPVASYAVFVAGALAVSGTYHYIGLLSVFMLVSLFSLATYGTRGEGLVGLGAGIASFMGLALAGVPDLDTKELLLSIALLVAAWALGEALRLRREQLRDRLQAAVTEERLRIARELHDVVAHSMSLIAVHAGVGAHVIRTDPDAAEQSLKVIAETSRRALDQTRSMLGILREEGEDGTRPPTPWLEDLPTLVAEMRAAGLEVELVRSGIGPDLEPAVSLVGYRIIQESLTNILRHSASRRATVTLVTGHEGLEVQVSDPGPPRRTASASSPGHGLIGLDERARLIGGSLTYGSQQGGYRVHATLPVASTR